MIVYNGFRAITLIFLMLYFLPVSAEMSSPVSAISSPLYVGYGDTVNDLPGKNFNFKLALSQINNTFNVPITLPSGYNFCPDSKRKQLSPVIPLNALAIEIISPTQPTIPYCLVYRLNDSYFSFNTWRWVSSASMSVGGFSMARTSPQITPTTVTNMGGLKYLGLNSGGEVVYYCQFQCNKIEYNVSFVCYPGSGDYQSCLAATKLGMNFDTPTQNAIQAILVGPSGVVPTASGTGFVAGAGGVKMGNETIPILEYEDSVALNGFKTVVQTLYQYLPMINEATIPDQVQKTCSVAADSILKQATSSRYNPAKYVDFPVAVLTFDCSHVQASGSDSYEIKFTKTVSSLIDKNPQTGATPQNINLVSRKNYTPSSRGNDSCSNITMHVEEWLNDVSSPECILKIDANSGTLTGLTSSSTDKYKISLGADWSKLTTTPDAGEYEATYVLDIQYD